MFEARVHGSLADIGRARWDACFPGALEGFDYLLAVEEAGLPGFTWRYVLVEQDGQAVAAAPAFVTDYALDTTLNPLGRSAVAAARRLAPRAFTLRLGSLGSPLTEDVGLGFAPGANLGYDVAIFEAVHGSAPTIAGANVANPTAVISSSGSGHVAQRTTGRWRISPIDTRTARR